MAAAPTPQLAFYQKKIEEALLRYFPGPGRQVDQVRRAMAYSLFAPGKRLRPILCLLACKAVGGRWPTALPVACALEYIHTYSLIHDDLPALDNDDFRRGKPTCHKKFGQAAAILAGDALLTEAFSILSRRDVLSATPPAARLQIIREIAGAAGIEGMVAGQEADLKAEKKRVSLPFLQFIHEHKTAALITASLVSGGIAGGGQPKEIRALRSFGTKIGLAFQIKDDLLNVEGQARLMGKGTGTDARLEKATYPLLVGLKASKVLAEGLIAKAGRELAFLGSRARPLLAVGDFVVRRDR